MSGPSTPAPKDSDLTKAWVAYQETEAYRNSKHWALVIAPMVQFGSPSAVYEIMPLDQRERNVDGSLWAVFMAGFAAAGGKVSF